MEPWSLIVDCHQSYYHVDNNGQPVIVFVTHINDGIMRQKNLNYIQYLASN